MKATSVFNDDLSILFCGEAGQGVQTVESLLTRFIKQCGYHLFSSKEYMSRVRGGSNSTSIRISSEPVSAGLDRVDIFIPLAEEAYHHVAQKLEEDSIVIGDCETLGSACKQKIIDIRFGHIASEIGNPIYANTVAAGVIAGILKLDRPIVDGIVRSLFAKKSDDIVNQNLEALAQGYEEGRKLAVEHGVEVKIQSHDDISGHILVRGAEAVGMGAIAGGCDFIASYPMSPSTGVLTYLAEKSDEFGIIVEQAEDEIAAINMAIGASYAGARSMVATSGGGFDLMTEGVSLAGMLETPVVIHLGQRPGPATGLPTRTEQSDLNLALHAGHGEFPRAIFAPGTLEDAFELTRQAFDVADRFQSPVFILTDQYLMDLYYDSEPFSCEGNEIQRYSVETKTGYQRYAVTEDGLSPRGVPGNGDGFVCVDSDEHDENGRITEDMTVRTDMQDKRLRKAELLAEAALPPVIYGEKKCRTLVVCWGSTFPVVKEAVELIGEDDISVLYFSQVYPLHPDTCDYFDGAEQFVVVENNSTGQFADLLKLHADIEAGDVILKYDGLPFTVEELADMIEDVHNGGIDSHDSDGEEV